MSTNGASSLTSAEWDEALSLAAGAGGLNGRTYLLAQALNESLTERDEIKSRFDSLLFAQADREALAKERDELAAQNVVLREALQSVTEPVDDGKRVLHGGWEHRTGNPDCEVCAALSQPIPAAVERMMAAEAVCEASEAVYPALGGNYVREEQWGAFGHAVERWRALRGGTA